MLEQLKFYINEGLEHNLMCYDSNSPGISKRLLAIMNVTYKRAYKERFHTLIYNYQDVNFDLKYLGLDYIIGVEDWIDLDEYYRTELNGTFPTGRNNLILAVGKTTLLGAY